MSNTIKCDGDHGGLPCGDSECWQADPPAPVSNVRTLPQVGIVTSSQAAALRKFCATLASAIEEAREAEVMDGLIVSVLHGHAHAQTLVMLGNGDPA